MANDADNTWVDQIEEVEAEVIDGGLMLSSKSFEIDMSGIQADIAELTMAIDNALTVYGDMLDDPEAIGILDFDEARRRERAVSAAIRNADDLRRQLNRDYKVPLDKAKVRYDELMGPVIDLHAAYKQRRIQLEELEKAQKKASMAVLYEALAPRLAIPEAGQSEALVPFEHIYRRFGSKWLNKGVSLAAIEHELDGIVHDINAGEQHIIESYPKHATETWAVFWQTLDADAALSRDRELCAFEERQAAQAQAHAQTQAQEAQTEAIEEPKPEPPALNAASPAPQTEPPSTPSQSSAERTPRVMIIDGATDDECRQIAALCKTLGITGVFKGQRFYETIKPLCF